MLRVSDVCLAGDGSNGFVHDFAPGQLTVVLGGNQAGKTNLCRLLAGLPSKASGEVWLHDKSLTGLSPQKRSVALVFQAFVNYPNWTVAQNIASPMIAQGISEGARKERVFELANTLEIADLLDRLPNDLSGGQQQRLAIARALAQQAQVLVLDEPLVNLDYKLREALAFQLKTLLAETRATVIYTSTDPRDAFALGDQVLLLDAHRKLQSGTPLSVYQKPSSLAAADLMSDPGLNLLPNSSDDAADHQRGVRPEHLVLASESLIYDGAELGFDLQIDSVERSGDETFIYGRVHDSQGRAGITPWVIRRPGMHAALVGESLQLRVRREDVLELAVT